MKPSVFNWREDKLRTVLVVSWLLTVFSSFFGSATTLFAIPGVGAVYPFRLLLPVTAVLYLVWLIREKHNPWKHASYLLRLCYVFCISLVIYGAISLFRAMDFAYTLRGWLNLCLDLCFFFLALELCEDKDVFRYTLWCAFPTVAIQMIIGIIDVFAGGSIYFSCDVYPQYPGCDASHDVTFFGKVCHWPNGTTGNPNGHAMLLMFTVALLLLYWVWRRHEEKCNWIPVSLIAPSYFFICAGDARLCLVAFFVLLGGFAIYALTLERRNRWVLVLTALSLAFVELAFNYQDLIVEANVGALKAIESVFASVSAASIEEELLIPLSDGSSLMNELFVVDEATGELRANLYASGGIRLYLLLFALNCFLQSKGMGVGLGNTDQLAKLSEANIENGVWSIHCFLARMMADFGVFFLIPLLLIVFELLRRCFKGIHQGIKEKKAQYAAMWFLYLTVLITYPLVSTAASDAQDFLPMWLFLAGIVLFPMHMKETEGK